jgi:putative cell wall-binding protein
MSLTDFKAKMNKSKINKYKINENNKTNNTKHECNVKYERYKQDISKDTLQMQKKVKKTHIFAKTCLPVMPSLLPQLLRQLKNNQNQTNTTGAQNLNEFNNTAGWLSVKTC